MAIFNSYVKSPEVFPNLQTNPSRSAGAHWAPPTLTPSGTTTPDSALIKTCMISASQWSFVGGFQWGVPHVSSNVAPKNHPSQTTNCGVSDTRRYLWIIHFFVGCSISYSSVPPWLRKPPNHPSHGSVQYLKPGDLTCLHHPAPAKQGIAGHPGHDVTGTMSKLDDHPVDPESQTVGWENMVKLW